MFDLRPSPDRSSVRILIPKTFQVSEGSVPYNPSVTFRPGTGASATSVRFTDTPFFPDMSLLCYLLVLFLPEVFLDCCCCFSESPQWNHC